MEDKQMQGAHRVTIENRRRGRISGVSDVLSFDVGLVLLETSEGMLTIKGSELHVKRLNLEKGEVDIEGKMDSFLYTAGKQKKKDGAFLGRLFS